MADDAHFHATEPMAPSAGQLAMLAAVDLAEGAQRFNLTECLHLSGDLDAEKCRSALDLLIDRHEMLRAVFLRKGDGWQRSVPSGTASDFTLSDLRDLAPAEQKKRLEQIKADFFAMPFDLSRPPLARFLLARVAEREHVLLTSIHHIIADGWSIAVLLRHFAEAYQSGTIRRTGRDLTYADWQAERDGSEPTERAERSGAQAEGDLPTDFVPPPGHSQRQVSISAGLAARAVAGLEDRARAAGVTRTAAMIAPLVRLMRQWTGQPDCRLAIAAANRSSRAYRDTVGLFASVEGLSIAVEDNDLPDALGQRVQAALRELGSRASDTSSARQGARVSFNYIPWRGDALSLPGLAARREPTPNLFSRNDLAFYIRHDEAGGLIVELVYDAALFRDKTARLLLDQYVSALDEPGAQRGSILLDRAAPEEGTAGGHAGWIIEKLAMHARNRPHHIALESADVRLTYSQLDRLSDGLADRIRAAGVGGIGRVAVLARRDHRLPLALLAIWKAGATASVWDDRQPTERLDQLAAQFDPDLILRPQDAPLSAKMAAMGSLELPYPIDAWTPGDRAGAELRDAPAVVQFTSGTTGQPKGVLSGHQALSQFIDWQCREFDVGPDDRVSLLSGLGHDPSLRDMFLPLWAGATLCIPRQADIDDGRVAAWLRDSGVTIVHATPAMARLAFGSAPDRLAALREVFFGGDRVTPADIAACQARTAASGVVFYGATETPQAVLWHRCAAVGKVSARVPVGQSVPGTTAVVLRADGSLADPLEVGELFIGGGQLCLGYLGVPGSDGLFCSVAGRPGRFYRTGDLVRTDADGAIHYVGRKDRQTKVRGFRVEPAEIETRLRSLPGIRDACVVSHPDKSGETSLAAFVTAAAVAQSIPDCGIFFFGDTAPMIGDGLYDFYLSVAKAADQAGLAAIWTPERHFTAVAGSFPNPALLTAALAATTRHLRLRAGSVVLPLHHPVRVAEDWAVLDRLSGGRAELALASGWLPDDFIFAPEAYETRKAALQDGVGVLRQLWAGQGVPFRNGVGQTVDVRIRPVPSAGPLPLWLTATSSPETFELAGRLGCNVLTALNNQSPAELRENIARLRQAARQAGCPVPKVALMLHCFVAGTDDEARAAVEPVLRDYLRSHAGLRADFVRRSGLAQDMSGADLDSLIDLALERMMAQGMIGSVNTCARRLAELGEWGVDEVAALVDFGLDADGVLTSVGALAQARKAASALVAKVDLADARQRLASALPDYMVPAHLQQVSAIPMTRNGKVDRTALLEQLETSDTGAPYAPPVSPEEKALCAVLADLTGRDRVGLDDDFFAIGGYSLLALKAVARFGETTGQTLPVGNLLRGRTVRAILGAMSPASGAIVPQPTGADTKPHRTRWPLSVGQQSLLLLETLSLAPGALNVAATVRLKGPLDAPRLIESLHRAIDRHPMLQTRFVTEGEETFQELDAARDIEIVATGDETSAVLEQLARDPIDRFAGPPVRLRLLRTSETDHHLAIVVHHTASDGESLKIFLKDVLALYSGQPLPPGGDRALHYAHFAEDTAARPQTDAARAAVDRAADALSGATTVLELPRGVNAEAAAAGSVQLHLSAADAAALRAFALAKGITAFSVLHAAYVAVLSQYAGKEDVLCGVATAGRPLPRHEATVGLFANLAVSRSRIGPEETFAGLIAQSADEATRLLDLQEVRFEWLVDKLQPERRPGQHPLVQAVLSVQESDLQTGEAPLGTLSVDYSLGENTSAVLYDLLLSATRTGQDWRLRLDYSGSVFGSASAARFLGAVRSVLVAGLADCNRPVLSLPLVGDVDRSELLGPLAGSVEPLGQECVHALVLAQARRHPDATAIVWRDQSLSYAALVERAAHYADGLAAHGIGKGAVVAISLMRSPDMIAALLGVLMRGAAYLPLDPSQPPDRYRQLVGLAGVGLVLADDPAGVPDQLPCAVATLSALLSVGGPVDPAAPAPCLGTDTACVLFTSGSTGTPKGVLLPHRGIARLIVQTDYVSISPSDTVLHANTLSFDLSNFDIWGALANGATLALADESRSRLVASAEAIRQHKVTVALLATGIFHAMAEEMPEAFAGVRHLLVAGDVLSSELTRRILTLHPGLEIINGYGPTECSTFATALRLATSADVVAPVPIGRPIGNTTAYVLNRAGLLAPFGMQGELYLGGIGVATGYLGRPDLTADRFLPDPYQPGGTLYRTGDIVRWRDDGRGLDFLGRSDHQVKIRGVRVEIGEIVARLLAHPAIVEAVVLPIGEGDGRSLVAFAVPEPGTVLADDVLKDWLGETLPRFLIPAAIILLTAMPLTTNGKIDRTALLQQHLSRPAPRPKADRQPTAVEGLIARIFASMLGITQVGPVDNFFDLGGNSLTGLRVVARIRKLFGTELPLAVVFANPTPAAIAAHLIKTEAQPGRTEAVVRALATLRARKGTDNETPAPATAPAEPFASII